MSDEPKDIFSMVSHVFERIKIQKFAYLDTSNGTLNHSSEIYSNNNLDLEWLESAKDLK